MMKQLLSTLSMLAFGAGLLAYVPGAVADDAPADAECVEGEECDAGDGGDASLGFDIILADDGGEEEEEDESGEG